MKNIIAEKPNTSLTGRLKRTFKFVDIQDIKGKTIVDIGCGYGWFELNAFKKGAKKIIGAEISEEDLITIKKYVKNKNFSPIIGHASKVSVKDKSIDTAVAWEVIEHIPLNTEHLFFKEMHRILKKDGVFYLSTPFDSLLATYLDPAYWFVGHRHYSRKKLISYGKENNFNVEEVIVAGKFWTVISIVDMYFSKWILRRESLIKNFLHDKINMEYQQDNGYANIFIKYKKI